MCSSDLNTWLLQGPGSDEFVVVDPGPDDEAHITRLAAVGRIPLVLISHRHGDHTEGIDRLVAATGATVRSVGSGFLRGLGGALADGEVIDSKAARENYRLIRREAGRDWTPIEVFIHWEGEPLICAHSGWEIPSAYGEADE